MNDDLISWKAVIEENVDKVRVSSAEIVVHGTKENPYYEIEYFDLSDNEIHIGFSSYKLDVVFGYLEKYFDIVNEENKSDQVQDYHSDDLISRKELLKKLSSGEFDGCSAIYDSDGFPTHISLGGIKKIIRTMSTSFDKEKVIEKLKRLEVNAFDYYNQNDDEQAFRESAAYRAAIEIVEKGGIE